MLWCKICPRPCYHQTFENLIWWFQGNVYSNYFAWCRVVQEFCARFVFRHGPLSRYAKLWVGHEPGLLRTFFFRHRPWRKPLVSASSMHHVPWCMSESLTRDGGEDALGIPGAWATQNFCVSGKRPMLCCYFLPPDFPEFTSTTLRLS